MKITAEDRRRITRVLISGSRAQREALLAVAQAHPRWYRAKCMPERCALAALYRAGVVTRRAWRATEGCLRAAYEYALSDLAITAWHTGPRVDDARPVAQAARAAAGVAPIASPMTPVILVEPRRDMTECSTCGTSDGTVKVLKLGWRCGTKTAGATSAALCKKCRGIVHKALEEA